MATEGRRKNAALDQQLAKEPYRFDFFQAVRLLGLLARESNEDDSKRRHPIGEDFPPDEEVVRFRSHVSQSFPSSPIRSLRPAQDESSPAEMTVTFMGMTGPKGVLPQHYTQMVLDRVRHKDYALRDYLDLFNHRTISMFYRVWEKYQFPVAYERTAQERGETGHDLFTRTIYSLIGLGTDGLRGRLEFHDETLLYYAGQFAQRPRTAVSLQRLVEDFLGVAAEVVQFFGQWLYLDPADQTTMPKSGSRAECNNQLGMSVVVGQRVWGIENRFRLRLGPLSYEQFRTFAPDGDRLAPLCQFVRTYVGPELDFDVQLVLHASEVPECELGGTSRLGWNTWVRSEPLAQDADEAVFELEGAPSR